MDSITLCSPAKINLFFRVLKKRPDGFHDIASIYQALSLADTLTISFASKKDLLFCEDPHVPQDSSNLILRAMELFRKETKIETYFACELEKKIPMQSGLGGGSSNAATTLWALNQLTGKPAKEEELRKWGAKLGSDVPFFFSSGRALCQGRGERVQPLPSVKPQAVWIARSSEGLATKEVYQNVELQTLEKRALTKVLQSYAEGKEIFFNDLEPAAFTVQPALSFVKATLLELGFSTVQMTGSGNAFFCLGSATKPHPINLHFFLASFIHRTEESWY